MNSTYKPCRAEEDIHRLTYFGKTAEMWNQVCRINHAQSPDCPWFLILDLATMERRRLVTRVELNCAACPFTYETHKHLFKEADVQIDGMHNSHLYSGRRNHLSAVNIDCLLCRWKCNIETSNYLFCNKKVFCSNHGILRDKASANHYCKSMKMRSESLHVRRDFCVKLTLKLK